MSSKDTANMSSIKRQDSNDSQGSRISAFDGWDDDPDKITTPKSRLRTKMSFLRSRSSKPEDDNSGSRTSPTSKPTSPVAYKLRSHSPFSPFGRRQETDLPPIPRSHTQEMESSMQESSEKDNASPLSVSDPDLRTKPIFVQATGDGKIFENPRAPPPIPTRKGSGTSTQSGSG